jgi:hypothetical protein
MSLESALEAGSMSPQSLSVPPAGRIALKTSDSPPPHQSLMSGITECFTVSASHWNPGVSFNVDMFTDCAFAGPCNSILTANSEERHTPILEILKFKWRASELMTIEHNDKYYTLALENLTFAQLKAQLSSCSTSQFRTSSSCTRGS